VGDALKPFDERVDHALARIKGENDWSEEQLSWLDRLAQALKEKVVLDDDVSKPAISTAAAVSQCYSAPLTTTSTACWISSAITSGTNWLRGYHPRRMAAMPIRPTGYCLISEAPRHPKRSITFAPTGQMGSSMNNNDLVAKLWKLCDNLRDGGVSYQNYVNELASLLFLKMCKETGQEADYLPEGYRWDDLKSRIGQEQMQFYRNLLVH
jgi:hypothetical protein